MDVIRSVSEGKTKRIILHPSLAERLQYKIRIIEDSGIPGLKHARKLFVRIQEDGNALEFKKNKYSDPSLLVIPLGDIVAANPVTENNVVVQIDSQEEIVQLLLCCQKIARW